MTRMVDHLRRGRGAFTSLRWPGYRLLWLSGALSRSAQVGLMVLTAWQAFVLGGPTLVALVTFAGMLTFALATPVGGLLADGFDRRRLVLGAQATAGAATGLLAVLSLGHLLQPGALLALSWIAGTARGIEIAAAQAFIPRLIPRSHLLNAVSLNGLTTYGARFVGPTIVGPFLARSTSASALIGSAYLLVTALYVAAVWHAYRIDAAAGELDTARPPLRRLVGQLVEGIRYMLGPSAVLVLLLVVTAHCTLTMSYDALLPLVAQQVLHGNGATYSDLAAETGIGAIVGTLALAAVRADQSRVGLLLVGALGSGVTPALLAVARTPLVASVAAGMGGTQALFMTLMLAVLLDIVPDELRGRAAGLYLMANAGAMALANLLLGTVAGSIGPTLPLLVPGLAFATLFGLGVVLWPSALQRVGRQTTAL